MPKPLKIDILCLFPDFFRGPLDVSMLKRAQENGYLSIEIVDIRDFSTERFRKVDDRPYGGGPGMVMMPGPVTSAIRSCKAAAKKVANVEPNLEPNLAANLEPNPAAGDVKIKTIYLSPAGKTLTAQMCREFAEQDQLILLSGHYEGVDCRAIASDVDVEVSIGDYVLTNGSIAALVLIDAVARFVPGVIGHDEAATTDSFESGLLDWPHYTRPVEFEGAKVPEVLLSGDHAKIAKWRREQAEELTKRVRPDLWRKFEPHRE